MEIIVLIGLAALIIVLLVVYRSGLGEDLPVDRRKGAKQTRNRGGEKTDPERLRTCPLCGSDLERGERVHSVVYPAGGGDTLAEVHGCPHCYGPDAQRGRICPVCAARVPKDGYIIGRMFNRPGKTHLHVLGCTECRRTR